MTGRVIDTGKPVVVPRVSQEPAWRRPPASARAGRELTYVAVPIAVGRRPGGTLEVVLPYKRIATTSARSSSTGWWRR